MISQNFCTLLMVSLSFSDYQWYSRVIERLTTVIFLNFFRPKPFKAVKFFLFSFIFQFKT